MSSTSTTADDSTTTRSRFSTIEHDFLRDINPYIMWDRVMQYAEEVTAGITITLLIGIIAFILMIAGMAKARTVISMDLGSAKSRASMAVLGMVSMLFLGVPGINLLLASIFVHMGSNP